MKKYNPKAIEKKWQKYWDENQTFKVTEDPNKQKFFSLIEFPYPSGAGLHVGHIRPFTAMDVISRKKRMEGYNVLYPIGFDAFGLPTENYAIKMKCSPEKATAENIATFTRQLKASGFSFDWSRVIDTTDPKYYKWTQWIFLQLFKHGLAYKKNQPINWCPKDKIGLANEEVVGGCCERCGTQVEKRNKEQWMLKITEYADKLLEGLKDVDYIPQAKQQQENWIGKSEGAIIDFIFPANEPDEAHIRVFTTRPDTIFGVTFLAVSAELALQWMNEGWKLGEEVEKYVKQVLSERKVAALREEQEKTGIDTGIKIINPVTNEEIPVWITNYVMGDVGTGTIMGVPAHDERDFEFAVKYNLPIKPVVAKHFIETENPPRADKPTGRRSCAATCRAHVTAWRSTWSSPASC
jgi:leucyl-tRNA synthetase